MTTHKERIAQLMGAEKYVIACAHLIPLPGATGYDREGGMKKIIKQALRDTQIFLDNGVHSVLFVNEADIPYLDNLPIEGIAAFATVVNTVVSQLDIKIPYGVNSIFDAAAGFAVANATGATFMRTSLFGTYATNYGLFSPKCATLFRTRASLGIKQDEPPYFFNNIGNMAGYDLSGKDVVTQAKSIAADDHAQAHALAAPFNLIARERQQPDDGLQQIFHKGEPNQMPEHSRAWGEGFLLQALPQAEGSCESDHPTESHTRGNEAIGVTGQPKQWPEGGIAQDADKVGDGLADANGACPAELMIPHGGPPHGRGPALDDDGQEGDGVAAASDAIA